MGTVYLVEDMLHSGQLMALKTIRADAVAERNLAQFRYEFAALGQLRHPNLVAVYDFGVVAGSGEHFFTMEVVPGQDLPSLVAQRCQPKIDYAWLYEITVQICRALQYIHSRGFVHYDVKPRNIRVTPEGCVKLMDFGLIGEARGEGQLRVRGTPEYVAPELVRGDPVDHRADLYSLGVSLYEMVTGRSPFADSSSILVLKHQVESQPEAPRHFVDDVPEGLQALILKLIDKEPANRYSSANEVIQAINALSGLSFPLETRETKQGYIQSGRFVGREFELARLQGLLMRAMQGRGRLVLIGGPAGVGKTRLVRELRLRAQMQRALVCEGTCIDHARTPYHPWLAILGQVISYQAAGKPDTLHTYGPALVKLMPALARYVGPLEGEAAQDARPADAASHKLALMDALADFLLACDRPLVLIVEDLQHADAETIELLDRLGQRAPQGRLLLCGIYRGGEFDEAQPASALLAKARCISRQHESRASREEQPYDLLLLEPLDERDTATLVTSMLGIAESGPAWRAVASLLPRLMAETGGNPLFVESVMHSLVEEDLLQYDGQAWRVDVASLARIPATIQEAAQRRLARLSPVSLGLLQWAAVMGQQLDLDALAAASRLPPERVFNLLAGAVQRNVLVTHYQAGETIYRFSNEPMREAVYNTLVPEQCAEHHRRIGQVLQERDKGDELAELLAWHFEKAGDAGLALHYLQRAADKARLAFANESAIQYYSRALALARSHPALVDRQTEYGLLAGRQTCYGLVGDRSAQQADLESMGYLAGLLGDLAKQVEVITWQVSLARELGNAAEGQQVAEAALDLARHIGDGRLEAECLMAVAGTHFDMGDYAQACVYYEQALSMYRQAGNQLGEAESLRWLGTAARRTGKPAQAQAYYEQALSLYRALGHRSGEALTLSALGILCSDYAQKRRYYEQALAIRQSIGDRTGQAASYNNLAVVYWSLGLYAKAREYLEQAVQIERDLQGRANLAMYLESLGRVYLDLGDSIQAQQVLEEGRALAAGIGGRWIESLYWLMLGRVALAREQPGKARHLLQVACDMQRDIGALGELATSLAWQGAACLAAGDWEVADRCTAEAVGYLEATGGAGNYPAQDAWWLRYQVLQAAPLDRATGEERLAVLQRAYDAMLAAVATLSDEGLRRNYLNKVKINRLILAEWTQQAAILEAAGQRAGEAGVSPLAAAEPGWIQDRLKRVLDISLQMNETHDAELLLDYVMDQVIELSGAERGCLVLVDKDGRMDFKVTHGLSRNEVERAAANISYTVLGTVAQSRQPILLQDASADERFGGQASVLDLNLRSVLCVPLLARSELVGLIYADNRSLSGRFSQADVDLLMIFASQAATAIENARLYQETLRANAALNEAYQTLEKLDRTKSDFIEIAAHELRTPLAVVKGYAQFLEDHPLVLANADVKSIVASMVGGANRLNEIVDHLLDAVRVDAEVIQLHRAPTVLAELVARVRAEFEPALQERQLALSLLGLDSLPVIRADPDLLYKVFYHLIVNAIKYTPDGGSITVSGQALAGEGEEPAVDIVVGDSGIGIDPAHHELIFEKFYQTGQVMMHSSGKTKFKGGGPGLGLAIAKGIVLAHGGRIWVESEGCDEVHCPGSRFHVWLPV